MTPAEGVTMWGNLMTQLARFQESHVDEPRFLVLDPENYKALIREIGAEGVDTHSLRVVGLQVVVIPIPETFYIAADPHVELRKHELAHE